jgi:solute carrier family 12 (potassium/chloride transporter), member 4/6
MIPHLSQLWSELFQRRKPSGPAAPGKLGTFIGVYTPTVLTILGVIMYLRFGWVVGHVGLWRALVIVLLANVITFVTALSFSAVATNSRVGVGGAYFIVSRSLGLEIGGAIGIPLFLSQALSVTLYAYGLAESLRIAWPGIPVQAAAFVIILLVGTLAFRGANAALRLQVPIMVLIALSLAALAAGSLFTGSLARLPASAPSGEFGFWFVFAVFFPAVTGIMAGLSLSGDLADPRRSIPKGTVLATLTGLAVYLVVPVLLCLGSDPAVLRGEPLVWTRIALFGPWLVLPGLWGAIFSSAVGSILGAPRTLQALAMDRLAPRRLSTARPGEEPAAGLLVALAIALGAVFLGDLNTVAEVVTMFFLSVYGTMNLVAALEKISGNPSWRPQVQIPWWLSMAGAAGCFGAMVLINLPASVVAMLVEFFLWLLLRRRERREDWGDVRRDLYEAVIRWALVRLSHRPMSARNWRPHILVFVSNIDRRLPLVRYGAWFSQNRGVVTACELVVGDLMSLNFDIHERERQIDAILRKEGIVAFGEVDVVANIEQGIVAVAQANGIAGIESNTVILGWPDDLDRLTHFLRVIRRLSHLNQSLLIGRAEPLAPLHEGRRRTIHVWWGGLQRNGDLMLLLAYLLSRNPEWRNARIRILSIASNQMAKEQTERFLAGLIPEIRIAAEVDVMIKPEKISVREMIHAESAAVDLVILGLATPEEGQEAAYAGRLAELAEGLPSFFFVHNGSLFIGELVGA